MSVTIYVGCALTHVTQAYRDKIEALKALLRERGHEVLDFVGPKNGTPREVWNHDMKTCVGGCSMLLAIADFPSTGLGIEIGLAIGRYKIPVFIVGQQDLVITRAVLDPDEIDVLFQRYTNMLEDVPNMVHAFITATPSLVQLVP